MFTLNLAAIMGYGSTRIVYTKVEAEELSMFGFKLITTEHLDDGRTKYTLRSTDSTNIKIVKKKKEPEPGGTYEIPDWM